MNTTSPHLKVAFPMFFFLLLLITGERATAQMNAGELIQHSKKFFFTQPDTGAYYAQLALEKAQEEQDTPLIARAYKMLGIGAHQLNNYKEAASYYYDALYYFEQTQEEEHIAQVQNNLATVYRDLGLYDKAALLHAKSLDYFEEVKDTTRICQVYNNLGIVYEKIGDIDLALEYYDKALAVVPPKDSLTIGCLYLNKGIIAEMQQNKEQALLYLQQAIPYFEGIEDWIDLAFVYSEIAAVYVNDNQLDSALYFLETAAAVQKKIAENDFLYHTQLGEVYYKKKDYQTALVYLHQAYEMGKESGHLSYWLTTLGWLRQTHAALGNYKQAFDYAVQEKILNDTLQATERVKLVESLEIQYAVEKKDQEIAALNEHLELEQNKVLLAEQRAKVQQLYQNILLGGVVIILLFIVLLVNRMRIRKKLFLAREAALQQKHKIAELEKKQLQLDLEHKNRSLSNLALSAVHKNEMLDALEEQLQVLSQQDQQTSVAVKPIQKMIKEQASIEEGWNEFKVHFEEVHPEFYKKLLAVADNLTQNDLRHCTYIKVKLDSKEIARIMGISPKSVQMSRYRIKKKLQLDKEDDLFVFVEQL